MKFFTKEEWVTHLKSSIIRKILNILAVYILYYITSISMLVLYTHTLALVFISILAVYAIISIIWFVLPIHRYVWIGIYSILFSVLLGLIVTLTIEDKKISKIENPQYDCAYVKDSCTKTEYGYKCSIAPNRLTTVRGNNITEIINKLNCTKN